MSDVRLSSGSPTLERGEPRVPEHPKPSACRSLFGSVDHDELRRDLKGHLRDLEQAAAAKWSFDFAAHSPLDNGGIRWELVDSRGVPDFYTRPPRTSDRVQRNGSRSRAAGDAVAGAPTECSEQCTGVRKRPAGHEPSTPSKRAHSGPGEVAFPSRSRSAEHTPRKSSGSPGRQT